MKTSHTIAAIIASASIGFASIGFASSPASAQSIFDFVARAPIHETVKAEASPAQDYIDSLSGKTFRVSQHASVFSPNETVKDAGHGYIDSFSTPVFHGVSGSVEMSQSFSRPQTLISN